MFDGGKHAAGGDGQGVRNSYSMCQTERREHPYPSYSQHTMFIFNPRRLCWSFWGKMELNSSIGRIQPDHTWVTYRLSLISASFVRLKQEDRSLTVYLSTSSAEMNSLLMTSR